MIRTLAETGSTNADLVAALAAGEALREGDWLVADRQTMGRGRLGRHWFDGAGNFMGSTLVRLGPGDPLAPSLALLAGLAVHEAVSIRLPPPHRALLKWPNDVLIGGAKVAGILLERAGDHVIVGIGVNLAAAPQVPGRETAALSRFGPAPDRDAFAADLARAFAAELDRWRTYGIEPLTARWQAAAHPVGTPLEVSDPGQGALRGTYAGLSPEGGLLLRLADGSSRAIHAGDVILAG